MSFVNTLKSRLAEIQQTVSDQINDLVPTVDDATKEQRLSICKSCEYLFDATQQCRKCGCFVHAKTALANSGCPISKWKPIVISKS